MSEITTAEIKSMTKVQNYMRGYKDGKSDVLEEIKAEIEGLERIYYFECFYDCRSKVIDIIDRHISEVGTSKSLPEGDKKWANADMI